MPRCGCADACSCLITAGEGINVEGIGTIENPYEITSESANLAGRVEFTDEGNVDFTATGVGTLNDPLTVFADAVLAMADLTDVPDDATANDGDVLVWRLDHWQYEQQTGSGSGTGLPPGGVDGQVLTKQSAVDGDANWEALPASGGGGGVVMEPSIIAAYWRAAAMTGVVASAPILWDTADTPATGITYTPATGLFTAVTAGWYLVTTRLRLVSTTAAPGVATQLRVIVSGALFDFAQAAVSTPITSLELSKQVYLNVGSTVQIQLSGAGAGVDLSVSGSRANSIEITRLDRGVAAGGGGVVVERPRANRRQHLAATSILNATTTKVPWDSAVTTDGITWDAGLSAFVAPIDGYYDVEGAVAFAVNATGARVAYVYVGTGIAGAFSAPLNGGSAVNFALTVKALAGQEISLRVQQTSGVTLGLSGNGTYNNISVTKVPESFSGSAVSTYGEQNYAAIRKQAAVIVCTHNVQMPIPWDTVESDNGIPFAASVFTIPAAGHYDIEGAFNFVANATGYRQIRLLVNNATIATFTINASTASIGTAVNFARTFLLAAGDTVEMRLQQTSGANLNTDTNVANNYISIAKVPAPVINGAAASGVWGTAPLDKYSTMPSVNGDEIYIDSAGQLRTKPTVINYNSGVVPPTNLPGTYPTGTSVMTISGTGGAAWPAGGSCVVVTHRRVDAEVAGQWCYLNSGTQSRAWYRNGTTAAWGPWVLTADSAPPRTLRSKSVNQALTTASTYYTIPFDVDDASGGSIGITHSNGVFTVPTAGVYQINVQVLISGASAAQARVRTTVAGLAVRESVGLANNVTIHTSLTVRCAAGDTIYSEAIVVGTGAAITGSTAKYTMCDISRISA